MRCKNWNHIFKIQFIPFCAHSIFGSFHFLLIPFSAHSIFGSFHILLIPFSAHSIFGSFHILLIPFSKSLNLTVKCFSSVQSFRAYRGGPFPIVQCLLLKSSWIIDLEMYGSLTLFYTPDTSGYTSAGVRNKKNFEIPQCAHMVRQNCSQIAQTVKAFNPFLLIVSKKDRACGFLKVFNKSLDSDFLLLCYSSRTNVA